MITALRVPTTEDLSLVSRYLMSQQILHRISEQAGAQVVWVFDPAHVALVEEAYQRAKASDLRVDLEAEGQSYGSIKLARGESFSEQLKNSPVVTAAVVLSTLISFLLGSDYGYSVYSALMMVPFEVLAETQQLWRLLTPAFMHFSLLHLAMNLALLWAFGSLIESYEKSGWTLLLFSVFALISNMTQYFASGPHFGGMSGVVYGAIAYCWLWDRLAPTPLYRMPPAIMVFMLVWLVAGFTGLVDWLGFPPIGNASHLGGLLAGLLFAYLKSPSQPLENR